MTGQDMQAHSGEAPQTGAALSSPARGELHAPRLGAEPPRAAPQTRAHERGERAMHPGVRLTRLPAERTWRADGRLLPTLFDRLRDDAPGRAAGAGGEHGLRPAQLRDIVQRDLGYLLNTTNVEDLIDRRRHEAAASSTLNFGVPALAGGYASERRWADIERIIRRAIADYEPRLIPQTVQVRPLLTDEARDAYNVLLFEIHAMIDCKPFPLELTVRSSLDLENSRIAVRPAAPALDTRHP
ncbi:type VI secretion system baseplate subunit TssE [Pseudacidovorax sp. NFM-22]|uniref:type VI secretion system baseplate subunit TssE n=1 Tax=Pseudacidovorax sp. NFM-22 TaxID=2744469 RepID=UPI001F3940D9|nr:type VI secretion system baseplate subunit TssE [Pseudacidovorax sp. NFM-22]